MTPKNFFYTSLGVFLLVACAGTPPNGQRLRAPDQPDISALPDSLATPAADLDKPPELLSMDNPDYPDEAKDAGADGTVLVRILCGEDGRVKEAKIVQGIPMLNESALKAARSARFKPATKDGQAVEVWMVVPITYTLGG